MRCVIIPAAGNRKMTETQSDPWVGAGERNKLVTVYTTGYAVGVKLPHRSQEEEAGLFRQQMKGCYAFQVFPKNSHVGNVMLKFILMGFGRSSFERW